MKFVMIEHYSPLWAVIKTFFGYKTTSLLGVSILSAITIESIIHYVLNGEFMGVSVLLIIIISAFIFVDWIFGSAASRKIYQDAKKKKDKQSADKYKFKSVR